MTDMQDVRRYRRLRPTRPLLARFQVHGEWVQGVEIVSLGAGGFGAWVEEHYADLLAPGNRFHRFAWDDPGLPAPPEEGSVVFSTLRQQSARDGFIMFGAEFANPPTTFMKAIESLAQAS
ncbi:MAG: hypothetical protein U0P81_08330 [Holophagaceae bacterium]